jgi:aspartate aminotransferase
MLERLNRLPDDPILGVMAAFRADTDPHKVDLGVGVYRDARGETPVLDCVRRAECSMLERQVSKTYVAPVGNASFNAAMERLVFGADHPALAAGRIRTIQGTGGCGALRLGAELIRAAAPGTHVHLSTPTWANHVPLISGAGLELARYPYYEPAGGGVDFDAMTRALESLPAGAVVLLHASCHNPTGADLSQGQWRELLELFRKGGLVPFIDIAYQGLGTSLDEDAYGPRLFATQLPELLVAASCSKNFGLYRERAGALHILAEAPLIAQAALSHEARIARSLYSMPPDHGAAIVSEVLAQEALRASWLAELTQMRTRITELRHAFVRALAAATRRRDFGFIARQHGMFSLLGITPEQVAWLRTERHIYMTDDSRINIAGLRTENVEYCARAVAEVVESGR